MGKRNGNIGEGWIKEDMRLDKEWKHGKITVYIKIKKGCVME